MPCIRFRFCRKRGIDDSRETIHNQDVKSARRIILARWTKHEFVRATRSLAKDVSRIDVLQALIGQQEKSAERLTKLWGATFLGLFWLRSHFEVSEIKFSVFSQDFVSPASYLLFVHGFCYLGLILEFINYSFLEVFVGVHAKRAFGLNSSAGLNSLYNARSIWSVILNIQYRFFKSGTAHLVTAVTSLVFLTLPILIALLFVGFEIIKLVLTTWASVLVGRFEEMILVVTIACTVFPWIWIALYFIPFKFTKNFMYIRWDFLFKLRRSAGITAPGIPRWLKDKRI